MEKRLSERFKEVIRGVLRLNVRQKLRFIEIFRDCVFSWTETFKSPKNGIKNADFSKEMHFKIHKLALFSQNSTFYCIDAIITAKKSF